MSKARGSTEAADLGWEGQSGESSVIEASPETAFQEVVTAPQCPMGFQLPNLVKVVSIRKKGWKPDHRGFNKE